MSTTTQAPQSGGAAAADGEFAQQLDTVVQLLHAANEMPELADPGLLAEMVGTLQTGAGGAWPGVPELLRSWRLALLDLARSGGGFGADDLVPATLWFASLQEHVAGRLDADGRAMLAQLPDGIRWLPRLSPAFVHGIARRLGAGTAAQARPDAVIAATPATHIDIGIGIGFEDDTAASASIADNGTHAAPPPEASTPQPSPQDSLSWSPALDDAAPQAGTDSDSLPENEDTPTGDIAAACDPSVDELLPQNAFAVQPDADTVEETLFAIDTDADADTAFVFDAAADAGPAFAFDAPPVPMPAPLEPGFDDEAEAAAMAVFAPSIDSPADAMAFRMPEAVQDETADIAHATSATDDGATNDNAAALASAATDDSASSADADTDVRAYTHTDANSNADHGTDTDAEAFTFDFGVDLTDAAGIGSEGTDDAMHEADAPPIWIGQDELELTRQAIAEQLLPLAQDWSDAGEPAAADALVGELGYHMQLVGNVLELIGTQALARGMQVVRDGVDARDPAVGPETVATWCSVLLAVIEAPGEESAELLVMAADGLPGLDAGWADSLRAEMARVSIGFDPAMIAARKTLADPDDMQLTPADDVVPSVMEGMLRELPGNAERLGAAVRALADERSFEPMDEARRVAHTIKGDANTVGVRGLAHLTHALEDILVALVKRPELLDDDLATLLVDAGDCVEEMADHLLGRGPAPAGALALYQQVLDAANAVADGGNANLRSAEPASAHADEDAGVAAPAAASMHASIDAPIDAPIDAAVDATVDAPAAPAAQNDTRAAAVAAPQAAAGQTLNVASALLDELQRLAGEGLVTARQIDQQLNGLAGLHRDQRVGVRNTQDLMARLDDLVALRGAALQSAAQQSGADIDPLEMDQYNELHIISRQLLEAQADSAEFMRRISRTMSALDDLRNQQEQLNRELQRTILRTRTVPFGQISARLQRIVRQTSRQVGKAVDLEIVGEQIPVDAELLERVVEPLAHLLRNAIDHGIETPDARRAAGKPDTGNIRLQVGLQGDSATIEIRDDGRGLDYAAIQRRAQDAGLIEGGLFGSDDALDERLLTRLILLPGFSTRDTATDVSGRGIGMDVVNQRVMALRGTMSIASESGKGTRISLRLPVTQTLANVIVARGQRQVSAMVASSVDRVVSFGAGDCRMDPEHGLEARIEDTWLPALPVESLYDDPADLSGWLSTGGTGLLAIDADGKQRVVLVEGVDDVRSVVVKPISAWLPPILAVRGITQLGDGGLAPVLDLDQLLQSITSRDLGLGTLALPQAAPVTRVVVADDSLSVRRALEQLMQDAGFEVATARDGFEALAAIQAKPTHALLVDLEMPRMNGLEVTRSLRNHEDTRALPVVMITSRATDRHQAMATEAGVTRMLGKPFSEDGLVALVRELVAG